MGLTEEQKRRVESVFQEALNLPQEQRSGYLAQVCSDDDFVRQEAASLLGHYESADELRILGTQHEGPGSDPPLPERIGPYEVLSRLGRGGMGVVYLARDPRLGRRVAIKILSPAIDGTPGAMERLRREALAASALNHPNILTVYEFGEAEGEQYIVSEYVEGTSLRELIGTLSPEQAVDYARQIGNALAAAHKAGIIHRDIKPENIMVRPDGYVKVLDFGLAKATPLQGAGTTSIQQRLEQRTATVPGMLIGTISYMSPEQLRGQEVDQRTDIWNWGVVLYEMVAGQRPFDGETPTDNMAAILSQEPSLASFQTPLKRVVNTALVKDKEHRFQSMNAAVSALPAIPLCGKAPQESVKALNRARQFAVLHARMIIIVAALMAGACAVYVLLISRPTHLQFRTSRTIASGSNIVYSAIAPNGQLAAYCAHGGSSAKVIISRLGPNGAAGADREISFSGKCAGLTFARDSQSLFYVARENELGRVFRLLLDSSVTKMVINDVDSNIRVSPDGTRIAFIRTTDANQNVNALVVHGLDLSTESIVLTLTAPDYFWTTPVWSPDGESLLFGVRSDVGAGPTAYKLMTVRLKDGLRNAIGPLGLYSMSNPVWLRNGKTALIGGFTNQSNHASLMAVSLRDGALSDIGTTSDYLDLDMDPNETHLLSVQRRRESLPWIVPLNNPDAASPVLSVQGTYRGATLTPSGELISQSDYDGQPDLRSIEIKTGLQRNITRDHFVEEGAAASPRGDYLVYESNKQGAFHLWRSALDGSNPARLTSDLTQESDPTISPDGAWVVYTSVRNGMQVLWKASMAGGTPVQLTFQPSRRASFSPDGTKLICEYTADPNQGWVTTVVAASDGKPLQSFDKIPAGDYVRAPARWTADGNGIVYVQSDVHSSELWIQPLDDGIPRQLTHFGTDTIFAFAVDPKGSFIATIRGRVTIDVVLQEK